MSKSTIVTLLALLGLATLLPAQGRKETLVIKSGRQVSGDVVEVKDDAFVVVRKIGKGTVEEEIAFSTIEPGSLYAVLVSALSPLDSDSHRRIADVAFSAKLFVTAKRHLLASIPDGSKPLGTLAERVYECEVQDIANLLSRADKELEKEDFEGARRLAMLVMRRYSDRDEAKEIPERLAEINRRYEAAQRRDLALARSRKERAFYEKAEKALAELEDSLRKVESQERIALRSSDKFRSSLTRFEKAMALLSRVERYALEMRQSGVLPTEYRARLGEYENRIVDLHIRMRLHVASLYTVRGSFGTALSWANEALAFDPTDQSALDARGRIEQAAAASGGVRVVRRSY